MQRHLTSGRTIGTLLLAAVIASPAIARAQTGPRRGPTAPQHPSLGPQRNQEHLAQWMNRHSHLPLPEQQRALEREPGFHDLSPEVQQRMRGRLTQLNTMTPVQRQRVLARTEVMEHLAPEQRQQVRGAMSELSGLPPDRRHAVAHAFRDIRNLPPDQRQAALNSDRVRSSFSDQERSTLNNLVAIEPLLPPPTPGQPPPTPGQPDPNTSNLPANSFAPH